MQIEGKERLAYIDSLKGFAIFCVLWGHSLQFLNNGYDYFHNPIFEFIYAFHMPLFFFISGFFFQSSLKLDFIDFLYRKSTQLLLPCIVWAILGVLLNFFSKVIQGKEQQFLSDWIVQLEPVFLPSKWLWFLWELFISYLITYVFLKLFKNNRLACLLSIVFVFIIPYFVIQRFLLPVFWAGVYFKNNYQFIKRYVNQILLISALFFLLLLFFWNGDYTMYRTKLPAIVNLSDASFNFTNLGVSFLRLLIGLGASIFWFTFFYKFYDDNMFFKALGIIGANTLAIYILQSWILENWFNRYIDFANSNIWIYNIVLTPIITLITMGICMMLIKVVKKNKYVEFILFGKS